MMVEVVSLPAPGAGAPLAWGEVGDPAAFAAVLDDLLAARRLAGGPGNETGGEAAPEPGPGGVVVVWAPGPWGLGAADAGAEGAAVSELPVGAEEPGWGPVAVGGLAPAGGTATPAQEGAVPGAARGAGAGAEPSPSGLWAQDGSGGGSAPAVRVGGLREEPGPLPPRVERLWGHWLRARPRGGAETPCPEDTGAEDLAAPGVRGLGAVPKGAAKPCPGGEDLRLAAERLAPEAEPLPTGAGRAREAVSPEGGAGDPAKPAARVSEAPRLEGQGVEARGGGLPGAEGPSPRAGEGLPPGGRPAGLPPPPPAVQVAHGVRLAMARGGDRVTVQLAPEHLGKVHLVLTRESGGLSAHFRVETPQAQQALTGELPLLRQVLETRGLPVVHAWVDLADGREREGRGDTPGGRPRRGAKGPAAAGGPEEVATGPWRTWGFDARA